MRLTSDQVLALADLVREHEADDIDVAVVANSVVDCDLYRIDETYWRCSATISPAGTVREAVTRP